MGGVSTERDISLITAKSCIKSIVYLGHQAILIDVDTNLAAKLTHEKPDLCFNALHGKWGEDGCVQGLLNIMGIPYTHSGVSASAIAMDKLMTKKALASTPIAFPESLLVDKGILLEKDPLERPYVVKPTNDGSSLGINMFLKKNGVAVPFTQDSWPYDMSKPLMAERYIPGQELTVGVLDDPKAGNTVPLAVAELCPVTEFNDYDAKYNEKKAAKHLIPADVSDSVIKLASEWAVNAHKTIGCRGASRVDYRYDTDKDELYMLEINTHPGMTPLSSYPEMAAHYGYNFHELIEQLIVQARCD